MMKLWHHTLWRGDEGVTGVQARTSSPVAPMHSDPSAPPTSHDSHTSPASDSVRASRSKLGPKLRSAVGPSSRMAFRLRSRSAVCGCFCVRRRHELTCSGNHQCLCRIDKHTRDLTEASPASTLRHPNWDRNTFRYASSSCSVSHAIRAHASSSWPRLDREISQHACPVILHICVMRLVSILERCSQWVTLVRRYICIAVVSKTPGDGATPAIRTA